MFVKHRVSQRKYTYGGSGIFDVLGKLASRVATKTPEMIAKAQANQFINKITKEVVKQGEKAIVNQSGNLAKVAVDKIADKVSSKKNVIAKQKAANLISTLSVQPEVNLNSLISGMGLKPIKGSGIVFD